MADIQCKVVTRTITLSDLTPEEVASIFANWSDNQQADFFHALHLEAKTWPGSGWWLQMANAADKMSPEALSVLREFSDACEGRS